VADFNRNQWPTWSGIRNAAYYWFNGKKKDKITGKPVEYCKPQFEKYIVRDFERLLS